jgi:hypothetical protein
MRNCLSLAFIEPSDTTKIAKVQIAAILGRFYRRRKPDVPRVYHKATVQFCISKAVLDTATKDLLEGWPDDTCNFTIFKDS